MKQIHIYFIVAKDSKVIYRHMSPIGKQSQPVRCHIKTRLHITVQFLQRSIRFLFQPPIIYFSLKLMALAAFLRFWSLIAA